MSKTSKVIKSKQRLAEYLQGSYSCKVPPVSTARWSAWDWINWINKKGKWYNDIRKVSKRTA